MRISSPAWALVVGAGLAFSLPAHAAPLTRGFAIVALDGAHDAAIPLSRALYARPSLRPDASLDEARAHVLLGEPPPPTLADLASTRAAIRGDDAPSRQLLVNIAADFHLRGIVVVSCDAATTPAASTWYTPEASAKNPPACAPVGRVFVAASGKAPAHFDGDAVRPDLLVDTSQPLTWNTAVLQIDAQYGDHVASAPKSAPAAATSASPGKETDKKSHAFYESAWFWGALGAAAFAGTAVFLATRDSSSDTTHLQMTVP